ncbi:MAG: fumarylacetoacetate hydrolase family protein [Gemmatimonadaceae bacterium]|nr:fumarylacetoacetate hydrolase family protein [Acetobacteraceae bacterium]
MTPGVFDPGPASAALVAARRGRRLVGLPAAIAPRDLADGIAVQVAMARLSGSHPPAGFKIGATARHMQTYLGLPGPVAGFMAEASLHGTGSTLSLDQFQHPGVECELAVVLARDLPPGPCSTAQAAAAVGDLMCAIEIVENRYGPLDQLDPATLVADQVFHAAAVLGAPYPDWPGIDLIGTVGRILVNGQERGSGRGGDLLGDPMAALAWLAGSAEAAAFGGLRAGQAVMLGSVTPPVWLDGAARIEVQFTSLPPVVLHLV